MGDRPAGSGLSRRNTSTESKDWNEGREWRVAAKETILGKEPLLSNTGERLTRC